MTKLFIVSTLAILISTVAHAQHAITCTGTAISPGASVHPGGNGHDPIKIQITSSRNGYILEYSGPVHVMAQPGKTSGFTRTFSRSNTPEEVTSMGTQVGTVKVSENTARFLLFWDTTTYFSLEISKDRKSNMHNQFVGHFEHVDGKQISIKGDLNCVM